MLEYHNGINSDCAFVLTMLYTIFMGYSEDDV